MITRLYVHNYRCYQNFALDLANHPSALIIGKNGAGKSTFGAVLGILQSICRRINRARDLISQKDFAFNSTEAPMRIEIELLISSKRFSYTISFEFPPNFREARVVEENLSVDDNIVFTRQSAKVTLADGGIFTLDWHVVALPVINDRPGQTAVQQIKSFLASMILLDPLPGLMKGFSEEDSFEIVRDASNFSSWLNALLIQKPVAYSYLLDHVKTIIPDFLSLENTDRGEKGKQLIIKFEADKTGRGLTLDFGDLADGEKCIFLSGLVIASNATAGPVFCFWDEPDNHLALSEVGHFLLKLRKLTNANAQFIATSHHPEAIRKFSDQNTFVFSRKSHMEPTIVRPLADLSYQGDLVNSLIRDEIIG